MSLKKTIFGATIKNTIMSITYKFLLNPLVFISFLVFFIPSTVEGQANIEEQNGKYGILDANHSVLVNFEYDKITRTYGNGRQYFFTKKNGKLGLISNDFTVLLPNEYDNIIIRQASIYLYKDNLKGESDFEGNIITKFKYSDFFRIDDNFYGIKKDNKWGIANNDLEEVFPPTYDFLNASCGVIINPNAVPPGVNIIAVGMNNGECDKYLIDDTGEEYIQFASPSH